MTNQVRTPTPAPRTEDDGLPEYVQAKPFGATDHVVPLELDFAELPWLEAPRELDTGYTLTMEEQGWDVWVTPASINGGPRSMEVLKWEPPIAVSRCRWPATTRTVSWQGIDDDLVYQEVSGLLVGQHCAITNVRTAEVRPRPLLRRLFLAFRRRCVDCRPGGGQRLVLLGPTYTHAIGVEPTQTRGFSLIELELDETRASSVHLQMDTRDVNRWFRLVGASPRLNSGFRFEVGLEIAYPVALAHVEISEPS